MQKPFLSRSELRLDTANILLRQSTQHPVIQAADLIEAAYFLLGQAKTWPCNTMVKHITHFIRNIHNQVLVTFIPIWFLAQMEYKVRE